MLWVPDQHQYISVERLRPCRMPCPNDFETEEVRWCREFE
jgi:hypothetical protein